MFLFPFVLVIFQRFQNMCFSIIILLISSILVGVISESEIGTPKQLTYLGSYTPAETTSVGFSAQNAGPRVTSYYYISSSTSSHPTADNECRELLSENATLLHIETQGELEIVTKELRKMESGSFSFWTGGKYEPSRAKFTWDNNGILGPWTPWGPNQPANQVPAARVALNYGKKQTFRTEFKTVPLRYICELKTGPVEEEADPCYTDNDLIIVVDGPGSGTVDPKVALEFTARLAESWAHNPQNRMSVVVNSKYDVRTLVWLHQKLSTSQLRDAIYQGRYYGHGEKPPSSRGLRQAYTEFSYNGRNVPRNLVFLTNGIPNDSQSTRVEARNIKNAGIRSFAVGIGPEASSEELLTIAGDNPDHVFNTNGFHDLLKLLQPVSRTVCP